MSFLKNIFGVKQEKVKQITSNKLMEKFYGHENSKIRQQAVNKENEPIPWYTYPAIEFLNQFDLQSMEVFEWGSGNSSSFFAAKVKKVKSVEHDKDWYNSVSGNCKSNQEVIFRDLKDYPSAIDENSSAYDIIIIDGQRRFDCTKLALKHLKPGGFIILDNSDWFYLSAKYIRENGNLLQVDFHGFGPINDYTWTTSVFFSRDSKLALLNNRQPKNPLGGLPHDETAILLKDDDLFGTANSKLFH